MKDEYSVLVVIRSVDERTTSASAAILKSIFFEENVHILNITPFSEAIREMFNLAMHHNKEWLLAIDADVLVSTDGINELLLQSKEAKEEVFQIQGLVLDKFFSVYRPAGNHLYRTKYVSRAISLIPEEGTSLRPESDMLNGMAMQEFPWVQCDAIVGIHDFEQYNADIVRKCFLQAHKHRWLKKDLEVFWAEEAKHDVDFEVALLGLSLGTEYKETVFVDKGFLEEEVTRVLETNNIEEKNDLYEGSFAESQVHQILEKYTNEENRVLQERVFPGSRWARVIDKEAFTTPTPPSIFLRIRHLFLQILKRF